MTRQLHTLVARYRKHRFTLLFASLLLCLGLHPVFEVLVPDVDPTMWLLGLTLLAAVLSVEWGRRMRWLLFLVVAFVALRIAHPLLGIDTLLSISQVLWLSAFVVTTVLTAEHAFQRGREVSERVFAALDAYLLAGFAFGAAYWLLEREMPGSLGPGVAALSQQDAIYFSFFTLTTLGLGNVVPANGPAKGLMIFEAVAGQMYMTVLVARLVSLYSGGDTRSR